MNQNPPKPMLDALARQTAPREHPSADVLTAFAENALAGDEYRRIADHLARCSECREVIFLSVGAADQPLEVEGQVAAAHREPRLWMPRLVWGASIATAVLVAASALLFWHSKSAPSAMQMASRSVSVPAAQTAQPAQEVQPAAESKSNPELRPETQSRPLKPATAPQMTAELAAPPASAAKPQTKTIRANSASPNGADTLGVGSSAGIVPGANLGPAKAPPAASATAEFSGSSISGAAPAMPSPAPHANSFAATQGGPLAAAPGSANAVLLNPQTTLRSVRALHPQWRITPEGHLEHLTAEGWTRVLADHGANFRVVSVVGDHVWVGGSGGALFHSRDDGQSWEEVALPSRTERVTATIVSIQFDDTVHGTVTTDTGTRCTTTDGGATWSCQ